MSVDARPHPGLLPPGERETDPVVVFPIGVWGVYYILK